jgi:GNAT superfamily N-acetyltransferase
MTGLRVRPAVVDDAEDIARISVHSWRAAYRGFMPDELLDGLDIARRARIQRERLGRLPAGVGVFVAVDGSGQLLGFAQAGEYRDDDGTGEVYAIYVEPGHWGAGAGRALMAAAVDHLTAAGPRPVRLWALDGNERARRFYERFGYVADGAVGSFAAGDGVDVPTIRFTLAPG